MSTFSSPRKLIVPSESTVTEGMLLSTSEAVPPFAIISSPILYIFLSSRISTLVFVLKFSSEVFEDSVSGINSISPRLIASEIEIFEIVLVLKERDSTIKVYVPFGISILKKPVVFDVVLRSCFLFIC